MSKLVLDLNHRHFERHKGPFTIIGTWVRTSDEGIQPCLAIVRRGEENTSVPCCIPLPAAHKWEFERWDSEEDVAECTFNAAEYIQTIGLMPTKETIKQLIFFIQETLGDLISIPPSQHLDEQTEPLFEATITDWRDGKKKEVLI